MTKTRLMVRGFQVHHFQFALRSSENKIPSILLINTGFPPFFGKEEADMICIEQSVYNAGMNRNGTLDSEGIHAEER